MLKFDHVTKHYRQDEGVTDLSFHVPRGQVIGLLGLNGSGKTTTLKLISGLLKSQSGQVELLGGAPRQNRSHVAFLGDREGFPYWMTPWDMARFMTTFYQDFDRALQKDMMQRLEIPDKPIGSMSKGQRQKLKLAMTLARRTDLYLLDEPLSGIDLIARTGILEALMENWDMKSSIILSTHEIKDVEPFLDRALFLSSGRLVADEEAESIREQGQSVAERFISLMGQTSKTSC